ncbi:hypothetical protein Tco_1201816 [Tanacetum coccineum]
MRTRSQVRKRRQQQVRQTSVESPNLEKPNNNQETSNPPIVTMDDNRTMAQLLEAPTEGYEDAIVVPEINANMFCLKNFVEKIIGTIIFGNGPLCDLIMGYEDYVIGDSVISRVYYVEGLGHNLFSVGQFCDSDLEIAFKKHSCFVHDLNSVDLPKGSRSTNLYTISIDDMMKSSLVCLLSKASKTKSWL